MNGVRMNKWLIAFLYLLVFVLIREWLLPVMELTETGYLSIFLMFIGLSFSLSLMEIKWWLSMLLKVIYIVGAVHYIYFDTLVMSIETIRMLMGSILSNVTYIVSGQWGELSNTLRTILFFVLLWMITYLVRYWIVVKKRIFLFYFMTVAFVASVDTFSPYSADGSIVMIMVVGLLLLGILSIAKLAAKHEVSISLQQISVISIPLLFALIISGIFMVMMPKQAPMWADPVPFIKSMADKGEGAGEFTVSKSGYDPDDSKLGGPFLPDDSLVFEAAVEKKQYWKVEVKDLYTSKGWEQSIVKSPTKKYHSGFKMTDELTSEQIEEAESKYASLTMIEKFSFLIYPYGLTTAYTEQEVTIIHNIAFNKFQTEVEGESRALDFYEIEYIEPAYSLKKLRETRMGNMPSTNEYAPFLQLPDELPDRVHELAESITSSIESVYDKAKAIERYFGRNGFVYDQTNVAVPDEDDDYVDQFLFDTKRGYCDNFSTSMVVMLRTLDIPARWVKGFAPGEISRNDEGERIYRVSNNEAHSWVEAYMPGVGWIPFEPTIGFSGVANIDYDIEMNLDDPEVRDMPAEERKALEREIKEKETEKKKVQSKNPISISVNHWLKENYRTILIGIAVLLAIAWWAFTSRRKWLPKLQVLRYRTEDGNWEDFAKQYNHLLKQLNRFGLKREDGETLAVYAIRVDRYFGGDRMRKLTAAYEKIFYGEIKEDIEWQRLQEVWEDLVLMTSD